MISPYTFFFVFAGIGLGVLAPLVFALGCDFYLNPNSCPFDTSFFTPVSGFGLVIVVAFGVVIIAGMGYAIQNAMNDDGDDGDDYNDNNNDNTSTKNLEKNTIGTSGTDMSGGAGA